MPDRADEEQIKRAFAALSARDRDAFVDVFASECRIVGLRAALEGGGYNGPDAAGRFFDDSHATWEALTVVAGEIEAIGPGEYTLSGTISARGRESGADVTTPARWRVRMRDGRAVEIVTEFGQ